jgi:hypothetical protein
MQCTDSFHLADEGKFKIFQEIHSSWAPAAHACNPSYLGGREQEDGSSRPAQAHSLWDPISKIVQKRTDGVAQGVELLSSKSEALSSNPSTT